MLAFLKLLYRYVFPLHGILNCWYHFQYKKLVATSKWQQFSKFKIMDTSSIWHKISRYHHQLSQKGYFVLITSTMTSQQNKTILCHGIFMFYKKVNTHSALISKEVFEVVKGNISPSWYFQITFVHVHIQSLYLFIPNAFLILPTLHWNLHGHETWQVCALRVSCGGWSKIEAMWLGKYLILFAETTNMF